MLPPLQRKSSPSPSSSSPLTLQLLISLLALLSLSSIAATPDVKRQLVAFDGGDGDDAQPAILGDPDSPGPLNGWGYYNALNYPKALGIPEQWKKGLIINGANRATVSTPISRMLMLMMMMIITTSIGIILIY